MMSRLFERAGPLWCGAILLAVLLAGCESDPFGSDRVRIMLSLQEVSGNNQQVPAGGARSAPLVVRVVDQDGRSQSGFTVDWSVTSGNGTLSVTSTSSDASGLASTELTTGNAGAVEVTASLNLTASALSAPPAPFRFNVQVTSGVAQQGATDE